MRFGLVHRVMTDVLAVLGVLAVVSTASLGPWTNLLLVAGLAVALVVPDKWQGRPALRHFATVAPLSLLLVQTVRLLSGRSPLDVAVEFAAVLQIIRLATRRGAAHDQQIIVLAMLHFVAGTVLGGGLAYGACFLGFLVVAPGALVLSHLRREVEGNYRQGARDRTGLPVDVPRILRSRRVVGRGFLVATCLLSVPILLFTTLLFVLFPRVGLSLLLLNHPRAGRMIGFSEHVDLGEVGVLRDDPTIALRFELKNGPEPPPVRLTLRLRGTAFDAYDGRAWGRTQRDVRVAEHVPDGTDVFPLFRGPDPARDRAISFDLEPIDPPVVFLPPRTVAVHVKPQNQILLGEPLSIQRGPEDELRYSGSDARGLRYDVYLASDDEPLVQVLSAADRARYLAVPAGLPARIAELAHRWTDDLPTADAKARRIEDRLRREFTYDLRSPSQGQPQPVDHFLFESRRGHCEFFSTAMALMLRSVGIPSRNVTGFVGGTWNRFGRYYAVREGDAHSWVEAYMDHPLHPGWRTFDPTPLSGAQPLEPPTGAYYYVRDFVEALSQRWNTYVVGYDLRKQVRVFDEVSRRYERLRFAGSARAPLYAAGAALAGVLAYAAWRRRWLLRRRATEGDAAKPPRPGQLEAAAALYRALEVALHAQGVRRAPSVPPLRHAEDLRAKRHPLAEEVLALTQVYLGARFGGAALTDPVRRDFERRVREIRSFRHREAARSRA
ncbi:MAG TPA: transglutaminaseTgpA domain-containing protein [Polyangiaceae bacterium]|nr:transglutaminaseTgpA domain-containing protein [Polyangiaceae bacterium]